VNISSPKRNYGLDVIRSFAILMVVASHCNYFLVDDSENPVILILRILGAVGVDLFFLLSGFLIGGILLKLMENNQTQFSHLIIFWKRRWFRTLPNYFLILIVNILIVLILRDDLPKNILLFFPFLQNFSAPHPDFFTEAWSLSIEEYAYLILPLIFYGLLYFFRGLRAKQVFLWGTIGVILILFLIKFKFYIQHPISSYSDWSLSFRKVVLYRLDAIYLGFLLIYLVRRYADFFKKFKSILILLGLVLFTATHYFIYEFQILPETHLWFYVFLYLGVISICCALFFPFAIHLKSIKPFEKLFYFLSTRSYAIYLVNYSIVLLNLQRNFNIGSMHVFEKTIMTIFYLVLTLILSDSIYQYFEKPILKYRDRNYKNY
jgi:peptidoglycan/LPS O-acetylase OafA/YrhL